MPEGSRLFPRQRLGLRGSSVNLTFPRFHGRPSPERSTMEERALRLYIRAKLESGQLLPHDSVPHVWGGPGNGETCNGCEEIVTKGQLVMEGTGFKGGEVQFHVKCFFIWATEREAIGQPMHLDNLRLREEQTMQQRGPSSAEVVARGGVSRSVTPPGGSSGALPAKPCLACPSSNFRWRSLSRARKTA